MHLQLCHLQFGFLSFFCVTISKLHIITGLTTYKPFTLAAILSKFTLYNHTVFKNLVKKSTALPLRRFHFLFSSLFISSSKYIFCLLKTHSSLINRFTFLSFNTVICCICFPTQSLWLCLKVIFLLLQCPASHTTHCKPLSPPATFFISLTIPLFLC